MRKFWGAAAVLAVLATTGCVTAEPPPAPEPTDVSEAPFASEEEALAAAEEAYRAYRAALATAMQTADASEMGEVATGEALELAELSVEQMTDAGLHQSGAAEVIAMRAADLTSSRALSIYSCIGYGTVRFLDDRGADATGDGPERVSMLVSIAIEEQRAFVEKEQPWTGSSVC